MRLIDADALKNRMFSYYGCVNETTSKSTYTGETLMDYEVADMIDHCIENAPTVDALLVVHGKAIPIDSDIEYEDTLIRMDGMCDKCGALIHHLDNYCSICGATMGGERKD